jgi:photosynthesis system II assembly factor YCF48-like protein
LQTARKLLSPVLRMVKTMAPEDRDRSFDKAVARHLRSAAASSDSANQAAGSSSLRDTCPDTETLAAYHERSLLPEELNSWKEHIVACAHCQKVLAHLELTDDIPLHASEEQEVFAMADAQHAQKIETVARPAAREGRRAAHLTHGVRWRWIAPAGAIAAGLLVWIAMHEKEPPFSSSNEVKMAKNQEPAAPSPPASTKALPPSPEVQRSSAKPSSAADAVSSYSESRDLRKQQTDELRTRGAPAARSLGREESERKDAERDANGYLLREEKKADLDDKLVGGMVREKAREAKKESETQANARIPAPSPAQEQNLQAQNQNISPKVAGPAPLRQTKNLAKPKAATPAAPPPAPAAEVASNYAANGATEAVMVTASRLIVAPSSTFVWLPGRAGLIEFSRDGGRSWMRQPSGVLVDLLTGSATSESVCWIVGRTGAILLTTDAGAHWKLLSPPLKEDLGGIRATDAQHATIWNAHGTKYFVTNDGGLTWQPAVHP